MFTSTLCAVYTMKCNSDIPYYTTLCPVFEYYICIFLIKIQIFLCIEHIFIIFHEKSQKSLLYKKITFTLLNKVKMFIKNQTIVTKYISVDSCKENVKDFNIHNNFLTKIPSIFNYQFFWHLRKIVVRFYDSISIALFGNV